MVFSHEHLVNLGEFMHDQNNLCTNQTLRPQLLHSEDTNPHLCSFKLKNFRYLILL